MTLQSYAEVTPAGHRQFPRAKTPGTSPEVFCGSLGLLVEEVADLREELDVV